MVGNPEKRLAEEFIIYEEAEDSDMLKRVKQAWNKVQLKQRDLGKKNLIAKESYM